MLRAVRGLMLAVIGVAGVCPAAALADAGTAQIGGRITAAAGTPIAAYPVCAYAYAYDANAHPTTTLVAVRAADQAGSYTLPRLAPATYIVGFADCRTGAGNDALQYAPGVTNVYSAHQYTLTGGRTVTGVDAKLQPGTSISGQVTAASDNHPLGGICVDATSFGAVGGPLAPTHTTTRGDGSYTPEPSAGARRQRRVPRDLLRLQLTTCLSLRRGERPGLADPFGPGDRGRRPAAGRRLDLRRRHRRAWRPDPLPPTSASVRAPRTTCTAVPTATTRRGPTRPAATSSELSPAIRTTCASRTARPIGA